VPFINHGKLLLNVVGIGRAVVADLYARGATIYAVSKNPDNLKSLKVDFPGVIPICVDLSNWEETGKALEPVESVNCLINNAAICLPSSMMDINPEEFDK